MPDQENPLFFYASPEMMTQPGEYASLLDDLPEDISTLCEIIQNNLLHIFWAERYGVKPPDEKQKTVNLRKVSEKLSSINLADPRPLTSVRELSQRQIGNCRDFTLLLTAILRHQGRPARARCGFGKYFLPGHYEDHWVCEYWNTDAMRWVMVDSQLDELQRTALDIRFDPLDVPSDEFITGGRAWQMCRAGKADPNQFGIFDMHGWWFIWGDAVRDFMALNKVEILPWDGGWGLLTHELTDALPDEHELKHYDHIAALSVTPDDSFQELRSLFEREVRPNLPDGL